MRFIITAARDPNSKTAAAEPSPELISAYMKFNEDLHNAGVLVASEGLSPVVKGANIGVKNGKRVLLDGPFTESKELVGGFYLIDVKSREEAIAWALKAPTGLGFDDILTIHPLTNGDELPQEMHDLTKKAAPNWYASLTDARR